MLIKKIGILYHPMVKATCAKVQELNAFLEASGFQFWFCSAWETEKAVSLSDNTDLLITVGGDGTILRAAQVALQHQIPITGINMGKLGFLTELKADEALRRLPDLLNGQSWVDERNMLEAELFKNEAKDDSPVVLHALNDVVLARGGIAKLIQINTSIDDKTLTTYRADGVILATSTGSTGYSLAAGGPVLYPQSADLLLVPIVSHLSLGYSLVLPSASRITFQLISHNPATLSIDGHINVTLANGAVVKLKQSVKKTRFLRLTPPSHFFNVLEEKLRGKK